MSSNSSNIDPALGGADQARQHQPERSNSNTFASPANTSFRQDGLQTASSLSDHQLGQHYYHYPSLAQPNLAQRSAQSSIQQSPAAHAYRGSVSSATEASPAAAEPAHDDAAQDESKRQRACEACRGLKVRCDQDPANPDASCKRCAKAGRQCVITQPSRKRQKKADSRVAELERKLDALTAALEGRQAVPAAPPAIELQPRRRSIALEHPPVHIDGPPVRHVKKCDSIYEATPNAKRKRIDDAIVEDERSSSTLISVTSQTTGEIFTNYNDVSAANWRNKINALVPFETSSELFRRYNEVMTPYCPMVVFPHGTHAEQILAEKPILYLAIITAASGGVLQADLPIKLQRESLGAIADSVVRNGEKSLELIQAMLVLSIWYKPPDRAEQTNFYQILHMAAIMSLDIGLGRRSGRGKTRTPFGKVEIPFSNKQPAFNPDALDARRAWLGCYYLCATASMVLRRPNLVRWTEYMKECIEVLENSPDSQPSDRLLCQHIKIQHICEDIGLQFLMDDSTANVNINDPKVTYALVTLENQLKAWKQQVPEDVQCASLTFFEHVTSLYLHEIALHFNHNIEDFRLPFSVESVKNIDSSSDALTQAQITATEACLKAAHGILDTIIGFTNEEILALPLLLFFVRVVYALVILIKMHMSIKTPDSELGKLMKNTDLRIEYFMDSLIKKFTEIRALGLAKPDKALAIMRVLREWYVKHKDGPKPADETAASTASEQKQEKPEQTPLHMLSQVASGQQGDAPQQNGTAADEHTDWTFPAPSMVNYRRPPVGNPLNYRNPYPRQDNGAQQDGPYGQVAGFDTTNNFQSYGWVPGVEQAMDMTLAHMGDLQAGGLDSWFLGDSAAPFMYGDTIGGNASDETMGQW